jgi:sugar phosphate isomerase/epimerase
MIRLVANRERSICAAGPSGQDVRHVLERAGNAGVDRLHLPWADAAHMVQPPGALEPTWSRAEPEIPIAGIEVSPFTAERDDDFERQSDDIYLQMQVAKRLGLTAVSLDGGAKSAIAFEYLTPALKRLTGLADRLGLALCLHNRVDTRLEQPIDLQRVFVDVAARNLSIDLDVLEFHRSQVNPCEAIWAFGERIRKVRLADTDAGEPVPLGRGEINIEAVIEALKEAEFDGLFVLTLGDDAGAVERLRSDRALIESAWR